MPVTLMSAPTFGARRQLSDQLAGLGGPLHDAPDVLLPADAIEVDNDNDNRCQRERETHQDRRHRCMNVDVVL